MPDVSNSQQPNTKAQDVLSNILQGNLTELQSITPWVVKSDKLNNKILRAFVKNLKEQQGWEDSKILEIVMYFDEAAELGYMTNQMLSELKEDPGKITDIKEYIDNYNSNK